MGPEFVPQWPCNSSAMAPQWPRNECDVMTEFPLSFPPDVARLVRDRYAAATVILEYGSGGSTLLAAGLPGKLIFSVESDRAWALALQTRIDLANLPSPVTIQHTDIGPTGRWGRPLDDSHWHQYHHYPLRIWSEPWFRQPDLILIDGRFRAACLVAACLHVTRPTTVLFDDYTDRPAYHVVERLVKPVRTVERMAEFYIEPHGWPVWTQDLLVELCTQRTIAGSNVTY